MSIRRRQIIYGGFWGAVAFALGLATTYLVTPPELLEVETWRTAAWLFLNANWIPVAGIRVLGLSGIGTTVNLIDATGRFRALYMLPPLLITLAAVLTGDSLHYTTRPRYVVQNCAGVIAGYLGAALVLIIVSGARPAVAFVILFGGLLGGGLLIGSTVAGRLTGIPIFGIASLGGLAAIGLAIILGGATVLVAMAPIFGLTAAGVLVGAALLLTVRSF